jgi:hypothetical protein
MTYAVEWLPDALNELAAVWMAAPDQTAVTAASHRLDRRLMTDPHDVGESRDGPDRIAIESPLQILFQILEAERRVEVRAVAHFGRR